MREEICVCGHSESEHQHLDECRAELCRCKLFVSRGEEEDEDNGDSEV